MSMDYFLKFDHALLRIQVAGEDTNHGLLRREVAGEDTNHGRQPPFRISFEMVILWWFIGCSTFLSLPKQPAIFEDVCPRDWCLTGQPFCLVVILPGCYKTYKVPKTYKVSKTL